MSSLNIDFDKNFDKKMIYYGFESIYNYVKSNAKMNNIISNSEFKIPTRYPDRGTNFFLIQFIYHTKTLLIKLNIMLGIRVNNSYLNAKFSNNFYDFDFDEIEVSNTSITGNLGIRYLIKASQF